MTASLQAVAARESQIVLGIDPDPAKLWPAAVEGTSEARARLASTLSEAEDAAGSVRESPAVPSTAGVVADWRPPPRCSRTASR